MKGVLNWVKANVWIVVLGAIILIAPPLAFVFSGKWNASLKDERQREVSSKFSTVNGLKVSYALPAETADGEGISQSTAPNEKLTQHFAKKRELYSEAVSEAVDTALSFNHKDRGVLLPELLPDPPSDRAQLLLQRMAEEIVPSRNADRPSAYQRLFAQVGAVGPVRPSAQEERLQRERERQLSQLGYESGGSNIPDDITKQVQENLSERRLGEILGRARSGSVYADEDSLPETVPFTMPQSVDLRQAFLWQFDYWVVEDLLTTMSRVNREVAPEGTGVTNGLFKRVLRIGARPFELAEVEDTSGLNSRDRGARGSRSGRGGRGGSGAPAALRPNSITEYRQGSSTLWDLRRVDLRVIVDADRVPEAIDALTTANFTSVVGISLNEVDVDAHLRQGYFYGSEPVVEATFELEMLWLREWTTKFMPPAVRAALGIATDEGQG